MVLLKKIKKFRGDRGERGSLWNVLIKAYQRQTTKNKYVKKY